MEGKVILITGGAAGFGLALLQELSKKHHIVICDKDIAALSAAAKTFPCTALECDVTDHHQVYAVVQEVIAKHGRIDVLINNAGIYTEGEIEEATPTMIKSVMDVNVVGYLYFVQEAVKHMRAQGSGQIINVGSQAGLHAKTNRSIYNASKWAVTGMTKCLAIELAPHKIRVSGFYPGLMATQIFEKAGIKRDLSNALDVQEAARAVAFMVDTDTDSLIPEFGMKSILE
jgi:NAD(P)-dependent dehydrogenase (short-subunit alcohol dehydrogenase family)